MNTLDKYLERLRALYQIAEEDESFLLWKKTYEKNERIFKRFAKWMPKCIRQVLWGYAEGGRLMMQRLSNIACECMEFTGERIHLWAAEEEKNEG